MAFLGLVQVVVLHFLHFVHDVGNNEMMLLDWVNSLIERSREFRVIII